MLTRSHGPNRRRAAGRATPWSRDRPAGSTDVARGGRPRLTANPRSGRIEPRAADAQSRQREVTWPRTPTTLSGRREAVGTVYRLPDGRLVLVEPGGRK